MKQASFGNGPRLDLFATAILCLFLVGCSLPISHRRTLQTAITTDSRNHLVRSNGLTIRDRQGSASVTGSKWSPRELPTNTEDPERLNNGAANSLTAHPDVVADRCRADSPQLTRCGHTLGFRASCPEKFLNDFAKSPCGVCGLPSVVQHAACDPLPCFESLCECHPCSLTFKEDFGNFFPMLRDDAKAAANWNNALILAIAAGGAIVVRQDLDGKVRDNTARHPNRWGETSKTLGKIGEIQVQAPALAALYGYSLWTQNPELHELTDTLFSSFALAGITTVLLKAAVNSDRPDDSLNGGQFGFPSYHTASSFSIAAVLDEYYGPRVGLPAYTFAGLIGWSRVDERDHDLSDVLFGAALGYVIGKSVAGHHLCGDGRVRLLPYVHPSDGSTGLMFECPF